MIINLKNLIDAQVSNKDSYWSSKSSSDEIPSDENSI